MGITKNGKNLKKNKHERTTMHTRQSPAKAGDCGYARPLCAIIKANHMTVKVNHLKGKPKQRAVSDLDKNACNGRKNRPEHS